ncbi:M20/M25/M40 family metallo-hydrolase [Dongia deserti]|uniref:M20/M25/M40 family metallo-hydrolase n=1 Tax=Dongia deserti TaxID=2268030 RepID=UPI000E64DF16|nr:M20/M25/M40 family metallo-hydrolase [Dongia deserti]
MNIIHSKNRRAANVDPVVADILVEVSGENLRAFVERLAFPRHYSAQNRANRRARDLLMELAKDFGYQPTLQGEFDNVVLTSTGGADGPFLLLGAHYDSVPSTPGADDNASAVAVCLECARLIRRHNLGSVMIVFFNREEDGFLGSKDFVAHLTRQAAGSVREAHIFEMVGYRDRAPKSQRMPSGLPPLLAPTVGDFLGLLANSGSNAIAEELVSLAACYVPQSPVAALKVHLGLEKVFGDLNRSDHAPFWQAGVPAIMWTDTSEFRNPHYHLASDTPDTLDYEFMCDVARLALARVASCAKPDNSSSD